MEMQLSFPFLILVVVFSASAQNVHYVKPIYSSFLSCPGEPCLTLDQYIFPQDPITYFTTGSVFVFLAGNHSLDTTVSLENVSNITFIGDHGANIVCGNGVTVIFENTANLTIVGIRFVSFPTSNSGSILLLHNSINFLIAESTFQGCKRSRAIYSINSTILVRNCLFEGNSGYRGGAILSFDSAVTIKQSKFSANEATRGGAINVARSFLQLTENIFFGNKAKVNGGAISAWNSYINNTNNNFVRNGATFRGGALYAMNSTLNLLGNYFVSNKVNISGGAIFANNTRITRRRNVFERNISAKKGEPPISCLNCLITLGGKKNTASAATNSQSRAYIAGLTYPTLNGAIPTPSIVAYYTNSNAQTRDGLVGIIASLNETKIILTGNYSRGEGKYLMYSIENPTVLSFIDRRRPTSIVDSVYSRNGFLTLANTMKKAHTVFRNLERVLNASCSSCNLKLIGIGYFASNRFTPARDYGA